MKLNKRGPLTQWIAITCLTFGASVFWGLIPAMVARRYTAISEAHSLLFIALPIALLVGAVLWPRAPKALGFEDADAP